MSITRISAAAVLAAAVSVILASPAQADPPALWPPAFHVVASDPEPIRPDDRAFRGIGAAPVASPTRPDDRADRRLPNVAAAEALPAGADGFDWFDAGIGAAAAFAFVLLAAGTSIVGVRHRRTTALS